MIKQYTTILIDMYGVILKESKGCFLAYARDELGKEAYDRVEELIHKERLFDQASLGAINLCEFYARLGLDDSELHTRRYIDNYLTLDEGFIAFAEAVRGKYELVLLSNDLSEWSEYICEKWDLNKYFKHKIVSADVKCRKPDLKIYDLALERIGRSAYECIFIDNRSENLLSAEEVGIAPILFDRDGVHYYGASVNSFEELLSYVN